MHAAALTNCMYTFCPNPRQMYVIDGLPKALAFDARQATCTYAYCFLRSLRGGTDTDFACWHVSFGPEVVHLGIQLAPGLSVRALLFSEGPYEGGQDNMTPIWLN